MNRFGITHSGMRPKVLKKKRVLSMRDMTPELYSQISQDSIDLWNKVEELSERYFGDMLFKPGSMTFKYLEGEGTDGTIYASLPEELDYFSYEWRCFF